MFNIDTCKAESSPDTFSLHTSRLTGNCLAVPSVPIFQTWHRGTNQDTYTASKIRPSACKDLQQSEASLLALEIVTNVKKTEAAAKKTGLAF